MLGRMVVMPESKRSFKVHESYYATYALSIKNRFARRTLTMLFKLLKKTGFIRPAQYYENEIQMTNVEIDLDKLDEQIAMNQHAIQMVYNNRADTIIMGADIMRKIMTGDPYLIGQTNLQMNGESRYARFASRNTDMSPHYERVQYRGLNVILIPYFEGFLILEAPRNEDYRNHTTNRENFQFDGFKY